MNESEELLDILSLDGKITGQAARGVLYKTGALHKAVNIFVVNSQGEILLQKRSTKKMKYPGFWDLSVGEHVKPGEGYNEAALRGIKEELGISVEFFKVRNLHRQDSGFASGEDKILDNELVITYVAYYSGDVEIDPVEVEESKFLSVERINEMIKNQKFTSWFMEEWRFFDYGRAFVSRKLCPD
ncbi:NUDIX domain-containing protein [Candidatus Daviesbacteria bacterium]|nr:NUDIX domain-containing protein [Candidatus Daviesbacteria bacterium]